MNESVLKIDIWSDVMCPFCYIGKRKLEHAIEQFPHKDQIQINWHSYQLDPEIKGENKNIYQYLADKKGQSLAWSVKMHEQVVQMAREVGLTYNFEQSVVANSFKAHRLIQLAKTLHLDSEVEELLFHAYFTDGKDISNEQELISLGKLAGLPEDQLFALYQGNLFTEEVKHDINEAYNIGVNGVPFFVFNNKYAVSGAQAEAYFLQVLNHCADEMHLISEGSVGLACNTDDGANC